MPKIKMNFVTIGDGQAAKVLTLMPNMKATATDMKKDWEDMKKSGKPAQCPPPDQFEIVRRLVREGNSGTGEKVERLGQKQIDGREAVGFRVRNAMNGLGDMTVWADTQTARPIRIEITGEEMETAYRIVMSNFHYDVNLDPLMFSLTPPAGYSIQSSTVTMAVEEDLLNTLRTIAERSKGVFPAKLGMNKEAMECLMGKDTKPRMDKATQKKLDAAMNKAMAKYGGGEKLRKKYGANMPPEIMAEIMKATLPIFQEQWRKQRQKHPEQMQLAQKWRLGIGFYRTLKPENNAHYAGGGVKLGTPDRPILWYKPTGAQKYRVIYADLSVEESGRRGREEAVREQGQVEAAASHPKAAHRSVPKGRRTIAQQFTAGAASATICPASPVGTAEIERQRFNRPYGTNAIGPVSLPGDKSPGYFQPTLRVEIPAGSPARPIHAPIPNDGRPFYAVI